LCTLLSSSTGGRNDGYPTVSGHLPEQPTVDKIDKSHTAPLLCVRRRIPSIGPASCEDGTCNLQLSDRGEALGPPISLPRFERWGPCKPIESRLEMLFDMGAW
jgi:hypothetical protein